jgi:hypothetical protein
LIFDATPTLRATQGSRNLREVSCLINLPPPFALFAHDPGPPPACCRADSLSHLHDRRRADHHRPRQPSAAARPGSMDSAFQDSPTIGRTAPYTANSPLPTPPNAASSRYGSVSPSSLFHAPGPTLLIGLHPSAFVVFPVPGPVGLDLGRCFGCLGCTVTCNAQSTVPEQLGVGSRDNSRHRPPRP